MSDQKFTRSKVEVSIQHIGDLVQIVGDASQIAGNLVQIVGDFLQFLEHLLQLLGHPSQLGAGFAALLTKPTNTLNDVVTRLDEIANADLECAVLSQRSEPLQHLPMPVQHGEQGCREWNLNAILRFGERVEVRHSAHLPLAHNTA